MEKINLLLTQHRAEFLNLVDEFFDKKYPKNKMKSTNYKIMTMGKVYENRTFTASYIQLVKDLIKIFGYSKCKDYFGCFMGTDINGFSDSKKSKNTIVDLGQSVYLSTYSSTEIKKNHLIGLLGDLGINIDFISLNSGSYTPACGVVD
jgi:hypothetical protein